MEAGRVMCISDWKNTCAAKPLLYQDRGISNILLDPFSLPTKTSISIGYAVDFQSVTQLTSNRVGCGRVLTRSRHTGDFKNDTYTLHSTVVVLRPGGWF